MATQQSGHETLGEKVGAVEIEKVATLDAGNLNTDVSESMDHDQVKLEKRAT